MSVTRPAGPVTRRRAISGRSSSSGITVLIVRARSEAFPARTLSSSWRRKSASYWLTTSSTSPSALMPPLSIQIARLQSNWMAPGEWLTKRSARPELHSSIMRIVAFAAKYASPAPSTSSTTRMSGVIEVEMPNARRALMPELYVRTGA